MPKDIFQMNYLKHREYKRATLTGEKPEPEFKDVYTLPDIIRARRSRRVYNKGITKKELKEILAIVSYSPSSCNRKGVMCRELPKKLSNQLVGAINWHKKGTVIGLFADMKCYKSEWEKDYMPYLDAGVMAQTILLYCEYKKLKACFINPNTHGKYKSKRKRFCGAIAIGK